MPQSTLSNSANLPVWMDFFRKNDSTSGGSFYDPAPNLFNEPQPDPGVKYAMKATEAAPLDIYYALPRDSQFDSTFEKLRERVAGFTGLQPDWDSYGAQAIDSKAVFKTFILLNHLEERSIVPELVLPTSDESVFIRFAVGNQTHEWEFFSTGEVGKLVVDANGNHTYSDVSSFELRGLDF